MQKTINSQAMLKVGTMLRGIYRIDSYLSSGGFGNTYVATNVEFNERVAIKEFFMRGITQRDDNQTTVSVSNADNQDSFREQREKFKKEARRLRQLSNPHIVSVHDLFEENGTAYYVMDYVDGENLAERLRRTGQPMTEGEVCELLPQILSALKSVHDASFWHLDLKPANIMVDQHGQVKLIDFGASKQLNAQKGGATTSTAISYTHGYAPREQMEQNYDKFGPWTDLYALGATLYTLLTNKRPPLPTDIDDDTSSDKHLALPFPASVSEDMKRRVLWMMKTNRMQRPQSVNDVFEKDVDEDTIIEHVPTKPILTASPKPQSIQEKKPVKDKEAIKRIGVAAFVVVVVVGIVFAGINVLKYDKIGVSDGGLQLVTRFGKYGYIDKTGKVVVPVKYESIGLFSDGIAKVKKNGKYGYINKTGKEVIPIKYESIGYFFDGIAEVKQDDKYGYINKTGKEVVPVKYESVGYVSDGIAKVKQNGKYGFVDKTGKEVTPLNYDNTGPFSEGFAWVKRNGKYGYIDKTGKEITPLKYDAAYYFNEGLARVLQNGKYGFVDKTGKEVIPLKYDAANAFYGGLAQVRLNGEVFYINKNGVRQ